MSTGKWYNVFLIYNGSVVSGLFSLSATAPTLPTGYTHFARLGAFQTDTVGNFYRILISGNRGAYVGQPIPSATVTITHATPAVIPSTGHTFKDRDPVKISTTGVLPSGLSVNTVYFVVGSRITANTFSVAATPGGAAITKTSNGSGTHTATGAPN